MWKDVVASSMFSYAGENEIAGISKRTSIISAAASASDSEREDAVDDLLPKEKVFPHTLGTVSYTHLTLPTNREV